MIFPKLFFLLCSFQLPPCTLFHPMLLSCEGGAAKLFLSRAIVRNARRPQKQKNSLSTLCFSFPGCVCRASEEKKKEKRMISASYMRFYFFGVFFLDTSVRTNIAAYGPRPTVFFSSTYFFIFLFWPFDNGWGRVVFAFFEKEGVVVEFCSSVVCRGAKFEGEKDTKEKKTEKRHNTISMSEKNSDVLLSMWSCFYAFRGALL